MKDYELEDSGQMEQVRGLFVGAGFYIYILGLDKLRARCGSRVLGRTKPLRKARFFGRANFVLQKRKNH